ncbi:MAG: ArsR family transcriptional regulator [Bacteroidota bacterium]
MLEALISSRTRIRLLLRFFINPSNTAYLRGLSDEFNESTNAIRIELNRFEEAGMIVSANQGNKKIYQVNELHPLFLDIRSILLKYIGIDQIIETVISRLGQLEKMYLIGDYALGKDSGIIDIVFIGNIDKKYLVNLVSKAEKLIKRKIRFLTYDATEWMEIYASDIQTQKHLLLWEYKSKS